MHPSLCRIFQLYHRFLVLHSSAVNYVQEDFVGYAKQCLVQIPMSSHAYNEKWKVCPPTMWLLIKNGVSYTLSNPNFQQWKNPCSMGIPAFWHKMKPWVSKFSFHLNCRWRLGIHGQKRCELLFLDWWDTSIFGQPLVGLKFGMVSSSLAFNKKKAIQFVINGPRDQTSTQGPKFSLWGRTYLGPMAVGGYYRACTRITVAYYSWLHIWGHTRLTLPHT